MVTRVLVVEDDRELGDLLLRLFDGTGYDTDLARDGQAGLHLALTRRYDLLVVDRGLPAIEGLDLLGRLRSKGVVTPALVLSALGNPADRVAGLDAGAEDYMSKPFDVDELAARLRALRRRRFEHAASLPVPAGALDLGTRQVTLASGELVDLSERECSLLELLARHPRQVFSRAEILDRVFTQAEDEGVVDTYVYYVRRKLGRASIATVRGAGYRLGAG